MRDFRGDEISWSATANAKRVIHIDHVYPYSRLTNRPISEVIGKSGEELADDIGNKAFAIGQSNTSKNKKFPGEEARAQGQWMEGFSFLGESDYRKMLDSDYALRRNWRVIRGFIEDRHDRIVRDIKREIR